jgi:hypothetical protein
MENACTNTRTETLYVHCPNSLEFPLVELFRVAHDEAAQNFHFPHVLQDNQIVLKFKPEGKILMSPVKIRPQCDQVILMRRFPLARKR